MGPQYYGLFTKDSNCMVECSQNNSEFMKRLGRGGSVWKVANSNLGINCDIFLKKGLHINITIGSMLIFQKG